MPPYVTLPTLFQRQRQRCVFISASGLHSLRANPGFQYIEQIVQSRSGFYPLQEIEISDINDVRNGMLLRKDLHAELGLCDMAFLRVFDKMQSRNVLFILRFLDPKPFS